MSATLALVATALETAAGASTSTNPNEPGYWSRAAAASESLAGATTSANPTTSGYMLRTALALESIAGTSGAEENANYSGYLKRIVDALEVQSGVVETGSLLRRLLLGAQNAMFGAANLYPDPEFLADADYGVDPTFSVSSGALRAVAAAGATTLTLTGATATALHANIANSTAHTVIVNVSSYTGGSLQIILKNGIAVNMTLTGTGPFEKIVTSGAVAISRFRTVGTSTFVVDSISITT